MAFRRREGSIGVSGSTIGIAGVIVALGVMALWGAAWSTQPAASPAHEHQGPADPHSHDHADSPDGMAGHAHAPVPEVYRSAHVPAAVWTNPRMISRGQEIYATRCAICHGDQGDGKGPAAVGLPLKPPDLRNATMIGEMAGNYWFWRISEGGLVEPFQSQGSTMPAWKDVLSEEDRWAVIAYQHTFSNHGGPHVVSEHPQMLGGGGSHHAADTNVTTTGISGPTPGPAGHKH